MDIREGNVRLPRNSLRIARGRAVRIASAVLALGFSVGCGGGAAAPTPTPVPAAATVAAAPVASPQRPALASPAPSPSAAVSAAATAAPTADVAGGTSYDVQAGDTLAIIADKQYGDASQWRRIYDANKDAIGADPDKLKLGMTLKIPPKQ
jgi:5'-nucleotidase/UDP-sugar diphosphatase